MYWAISIFAAAGPKPTFPDANVEIAPVQRASPVNLARRTGQLREKQNVKLIIMATHMQMYWAIARKNKMLNLCLHTCKRTGQLREKQNVKLMATHNYLNIIFEIDVCVWCLERKSKFPLGIDGGFSDCEC